LNPKTILLVEDNPQDETLTLRALHQARVVNRIDVARDGQQAPDYLFREGEFAATVAQLGIYWLATNEPPPDR
jgi:hypothetical protein